MKQFDVTGMSCAACSARVEKAVLGVNGVSSCSVNLLTNSMTVEGTANPDEIINVVVKAGYGARVKGKTYKEKENLGDEETLKMKKRLIVSVIFLAILMYFSMGHMMLNLPIPEFLNNNYLGQGLLQLLLCVAVMVINQKFFIKGIDGLVKKAPNMDTLVALGSGAAFIYSVYALFMMTIDIDGAHKYLHELYFESSAMILALITVGKMLEARSKGKTTDAIKSLMKMAPTTASMIIDGVETKVPVDRVKKGDVFVVRPGDKIPVDGEVIKGESAVDESSLTGESVPRDKEKGAKVYASTINLSGYMECSATHVGEDTTWSRIIKMVTDASASKAPIAKIADRVSGVFVPSVIVIAIITIISWLLLGESVGYALARGISVLVISCPCALGLATPVAIMVGNGVGAKKGILFKTATALEETGKTKIVVLDKTGTITKGEPEVTDILTCEGMDEEGLLSLANNLEIKSEHPLAKAIIKKAKEENILPNEIEAFEIFPGNGLSALYDGKILLGGNFNFISSKVSVEEEISKNADEFSKEGKTPLFFAYDDRLIGIIAVADVIKEDSKEAIGVLKSMGIRVVMLTGDNQRTANTIGKLAGVDEVIADVLPDEKQEKVKEFKKAAKTAMVGDGINDAPALATADTGIAIGKGADIAIDSADLVLVNSSIMDVAAAIRLSRATLKNIKENLFWAFIYNVVGIPLAAGVFIGWLGWELNPMFGAAAMSLSSFSVVSNALRLNIVDIYNFKKTKKKEKKTMEKIFKVEGMMCPHCEGRVKDAVLKIPNITEVIASSKDGTVKVTLTEDVADEVIKNTIIEQGYKVL